MLISKYTFCNIRLKKFPSMATEWVLRITNESQLLDYMEKTTETRVWEAVTDFKQVKAGQIHTANALSMVCDVRGSARGESFAQALVGVLDDVYHNRLKLLNEGNVIYIKASGGYSYDSLELGLYEILETRELDSLEFPTIDVRYIQWPNGTHVYAKIGDVDVEWDGKCKWDTMTEAEEAVRQWKRNRKVRTGKVKMDTWR